MDKEELEYVRTMAYCSLIKKEQTADTTGPYDRMEDSQKHYTASKNPDTTEIILPDSTYIKV